MSDSNLIVDQLEEALEERQGSDRRKSDNGIDPVTGAERRKGDRRENQNIPKKQ